MLLLEHFIAESTKFDHVRCPLCKSGRLCDKPVEEKVVVPLKSNVTSNQSNNKIILKCPKCNQQIIICFQNK